MWAIDRSNLKVGQRFWPRHGSAVVAVAAAVMFSPAVIADVQPVTQSGGPPELPHATFEETGLPNFNMPVGKPTFPDGTVVPVSAPGGGSGLGAPGNGADSKSMNSMMSRPWGYAASQNAEALGITPVALAATCQIEAGGCQTNPSSASTTITGTFQMLDSTYTAAMKAALAENPGLAASIVPGLAGKLDPATEAIAAAQYLKQGALSLQQNGIDNPSVLDVRGYYNFGPGNAASIARANDSELMSTQISGLTTVQFRANGIDPGTTTVGQWRASVTSKIDASAASAPVLLARK